MSLWARIILAHPSAVLWMVSYEEYALQNLRRELDSRSLSGRCERAACNMEQLATWSIVNSLSIGTTIQMVKVPQGATPVYVAVMNTNAGQSTLTVGDGLNDARYRTHATLSALQGLVPINTQYLPYTYSTDDTIDVFISLVSVSTLNGAITVLAISGMDVT